MAEKNQTITHEELTSFFKYDPETGVFTWARSKKGAPLGSIAGSKDVHGYVLIIFNGKSYRAHRLAWFYVHGLWPDSEIDHKNRIRDDNRLCNLRPATRQQQNMNKVQRQSSGLPGVYLEKRSKASPFKSQVRYPHPITGASMLKHLGVFKTADEAYEVYDLACQMVHGEFYRGRA